jgi:hypothetical protein
MGIRRAGRTVHDRIIEIKEYFGRSSPDPVKFDGGKQSPLYADHVEGGKLLVNHKPFHP